ncbi:MAG: nucleotide-binding protein [Elusimicrobiota bacterium]
MKLSIAALAAALAVALAPSLRAEDITGTVLETMDSGGYTYLRLKTPSGDRWAAVMKAKVKKGDTATVVNTMEMKDFKSPTLKRTFKRIAFGLMGGAAAPANPHPEAAADPHAAAAKDASRAPEAAPIKVDKASSPDGRTIAEVYAQKAALKGKDVAVRGKIVKYNPGIMDRNWAHLRDGSGQDKDGSNDLTVLLKDSAELGQVVTVRGKVALDKDLGGMYQFPVSLEDATLVK